jgi:hypothetical protein
MKGVNEQVLIFAAFTLLVVLFVFLGFVRHFTGIAYSKQVGDTHGGVLDLVRGASSSSLDEAAYKIPAGEFIRAVVFTSSRTSYSGSRDYTCPENSAYYIIIDPIIRPPPITQPGNWLKYNLLQKKDPICEGVAKTLVVPQECEKLEGKSGREYCIIIKKEADDKVYIKSCKIMDTATLCEVPRG